MEKKSVLKILLFSVAILCVVLKALGFGLISQIGVGIVAIITLILNKSNLKAIPKKNFSAVMAIMLIPVFIFIYAVFFQTDNVYLLYGSLICFFVSIPISIAIVYVNKKNNI